MKEDIDVLRVHYDELVAEYGDTPGSSQWADENSQLQRFKVLSEISDLRNRSVLDFGCGAGKLLPFLRETCGYTGNYTGIDISSNAIDIAKKKYSDAEFICCNIFEEELPRKYDYVLISGVFNNLIGDNWGYFTSLLKRLFSGATKGLAFNALSTYVDFYSDGLWYLSPLKAFDYCKSYMSPCVELRHDYHVKKGVLPYEFSMYIYKSNELPRNELQTI